MNLYLRVHQPVLVRGESKSRKLDQDIRDLFCTGERPPSDDTWITREELQRIDPDLLESYQSRVDPGGVLPTTSPVVGTSDTPERVPDTVPELLLNPDPALFVIRSSIPELR